jgi:hypothetical protein
MTCTKTCESLEGKELDYMIRISDLEMRIKYLENIEHAARRYFGRLDKGKKSRAKGQIRSAKLALLDALYDFETLEIEAWQKKQA